MVSAAVTLAALTAAAAGALAAGPFGRRLPPVAQAGRPERSSAAGGRHSGRVAWPCGAAAAIGLHVGGPVGAVLAGLGLAGLSRAVRRADARRRAARHARACAEVLDALTSELDSGMAPPAALASAIRATRPDADPGLAGVTRALRDGAEPAAALTGCDGVALRNLGMAWRVCHGEGVRLAPVVGRLADVVRQDLARGAETSAALAGPRASGRLLAALPVAGFGLGSLIGAAPAHFLLETPIGTACLLTGVAFDAAGLMWMNRLSDRAEAGPGGTAGPAATRPETGSTRSPGVPAAVPGGSAVPRQRRPT